MPDAIGMIPLEKVEQISVKHGLNLNEAVIQQTIWDNPRILGLGPLVPLYKERVQPNAGRLDLLLESQDGKSWYEVEVQLGATDPSHIIRTIEYWDIEQKRNPNKQHTAVIVAEDITSRYFNVISLFNQAIPIIALKMSAVSIGGKFGLLFTKILDISQQQETTGEDNLPADRDIWNSRSSSTTMKLMDQIIQVARESNPNIELKYNKGYIGTIVNGEVSNFLTFRPRKRDLHFGVYLPSTPENDKACEDAGLMIDYDPRYSKYRFVLFPETFEKTISFFRDFIHRSYEEGA